MKRNYPLSSADFKQILHPPTSGSVQDDSPELNGSGFFCSGPDLPGSGKRIIVRYASPGPRPAASRTGNNCSLFCLGAFGSLPEKNYCSFYAQQVPLPSAGSGIGVKIVRDREDLGSSAAVPGHHSPALLYLQPEKKRTIVRFRMDAQRNRTQINLIICLTNRQ